MLDTLVDYNDHHNAPLSNEKLRQAISKVMEETEEEECDIIFDANNVTMNHFCEYPVMTNKQRENANAILASERRNTLDMLSETLKILVIDSTINESAYYNSDKDDAEIDPKK